MLRPYQRSALERSRLLQQLDYALEQTPRAAREIGRTVKLLAICERVRGPAGTESVSARVYPAMIPRSHPLASVDGAFNAVYVEADAAGALMFYGQGAGGAPTAWGLT